MAVRGPAARAARALLGPLWRRFWGRIERRIAPLEAWLGEAERRRDAEHRTLWASIRAAEQRTERAEGASARLGARTEALEARASALDAALEALGGRTGALEERLAQRELEWREELALMQAAADSVRALGFAIAEVRAELGVGRGAPASDSAAVGVMLGPGGATIRLCARGESGVEAIAAVHALPFGAESLDAIACGRLMEGLAPGALATLVLPHWRSLLREGGTLRASLLDWEALARGLTAAQVRARLPLRSVFTREEACTLFSAAGFRSVDAHAGREGTFEVVGWRR